MTISIVAARAELPCGFEALRDEARSEGHTHMDRLAADWCSGVNRFDGDGEALLAAFVSGELVGVGGLTRNPADTTALRMRRFYVRIAYRRHGIARCLAEALMERACRGTDRLVLNAETELAAAFWEAMGFVREHGNDHTHVRRLPADGSAKFK